MSTSGPHWFGRTTWVLAALAALSCVAAVGAAPSPAKAMQRDSPEATSLSLSATPALVDYGGSTTLAGGLSAAGGPVAGVTLDLDVLDRRRELVAAGGGRRPTPRAGSRSK